MSDLRTFRPAAVAWMAAALVAALCAAASSDARVALAAASAPPGLRALGAFVTRFGASGYMFTCSGLVVACALIALQRGVRRVRGASLRLVAERAGFFFAVIAASGIAAQAIKHLVGRARPHLLAGDGAFHFHALTLGSAEASFPSGHAASAFAAAVALGYMAPRWRMALLGAALLVGLSRVIVGAHYPSDVLAGAALGSAVAAWLARDFARRGLAFGDRRGRAVPEPPREPAAVRGEPA